MASEGLGGAGEAAPRAERPPSPAVCGRPSGPATAPGLAAGHRTQEVGRNRHRLCRPHLSKRPGAVRRPRAGLGISCPRYAAPPRMRGAQTHQRRGREPGAPPLRGGLRKSAPRLAARPGAPWAGARPGGGRPRPAAGAPAGLLPLPPSRSRRACCGDTGSSHPTDVEGTVRRYVVRALHRVLAANARFLSITGYLTPLPLFTTPRPHPPVTAKLICVRDKKSFLRTSMPCCVKRN